MAAATHRSDERLTPRRKALAGLGVCLIVPLSVGFGLTVPLPDIVERVAGSFLSGRQLLAFDSKASDGSRRGVWIVLTPEERKAIRRELPVPAASWARTGADETVVVPLESGSPGTTTAGPDGGSAAGEADAAGSAEADAVVAGKS